MRNFSTIQINGNIKWFDHKKGYGFVVYEGGERDAFLHISVLEKSGFSAPDTGDAITAMVEIGHKVTVVAVKSMIIGDGASVKDDHKPKVSHNSKGSKNSAIIAERTVNASGKFYDAKKGYGFVETEDGDIFVHVSILHKCGLDTIEPGVMYSVNVGSSERGDVAVSLSEI